MQQSILDLHNKISLSLAHSLKTAKISVEDTIAYMVFFDALWEDEKLIKSCILSVWKADNMFEDLIVEIEGGEKELVDTTEAQKLLQKIKTNTY